MVCKSVNGKSQLTFINAEKLLCLIERKMDLR